MTWISGCLLRYSFSSSNSSSVSPLQFQERICNRCCARIDRFLAAAYGFTGSYTTRLLLHCPTHSFLARLSPLDSSSQRSFLHSTHTYTRNPERADIEFPLLCPSSRRTRGRTVNPHAREKIGRSIILRCTFSLPELGPGRACTPKRRKGKWQKR